MLSISILFTITLASGQEKTQIQITTIDGEWWKVTGDPDLGEYASPNRMDLGVLYFSVWIHIYL